MTTPAALWRITTHWAHRFGCPVQLLSEASITAVAHAATSRWPGAYLFEHGVSCIVSVPRQHLARVRGAVAGKSLPEVFTPEFAGALFDGQVESIIGPAWLGYADSSDFHPVVTTGVRQLDSSDGRTLRRFARECGEDWEQSGIELDRPPVFGRFVEGKLVSAGTLDPSAIGILNVGIVTHPEHRGRGYGREVASELTRYGLSKGAIVQYRTLESNLPSKRIAQQLGYQQYGRTIAVRLLVGGRPSGHPDSFDELDGA